MIPFKQKRGIVVGGFGEIKKGNAPKTARLSGDALLFVSDRTLHGAGRRKVAEAENLSGVEISNLQLALKESYEVLLGAVDVWELNYLIKSPIRGEVNFSKFWSNNQNVTKGEAVFTVIPEGNNILIGKVQLKMNGAGKVKVGQHVNLKFTNYPYLEYGLVKGVVSRISGVPTNDYYALEVKLPDQLVSTYGKKFEFQQELQGTAEIITEDQRLLNRILHPMRAVFSERFAK